MIVEITTVVAGLILASGLLPNIIAVGNSLEIVAKWLGRFQTIIGVIAMVIGIWGLL
jgi:sulfite exporter TauE/SafE